MDSKSNIMTMVGGEFREQFRQYEEAFQELCALLGINDEDLEELKEEVYDKVHVQQRRMAIASLWEQPP